MPSLACEITVSRELRRTRLSLVCVRRHFLEYLQVLLIELWCVQLQAPSTGSDRGAYVCGE